MPPGIYEHERCVNQRGFLCIRFAPQPEAWLDGKASFEKALLQHGAYLTFEKSWIQDILKFLQMILLSVTWNSLVVLTI